MAVLCYDSLMRVYYFVAVSLVALYVSIACSRELEKIIVFDSNGTYFYVIEDDGVGPLHERGYSPQWHLYSYPEEEYLASFQSAQYDLHELIFRGVKLGSRNELSYTISSIISATE